MAQLKEYNDGNTFLLTVVDVFSKYGFAKPLLNNKGCTVLKAFQEILTDSNENLYIVKLIWVRNLPIENSNVYYMMWV